MYHVDVCGPMKVHSLRGRKYMLMVVDKFSRRYFIAFVNSKDKVKEGIIYVMERGGN